MAETIKKNQFSGSVGAGMKSLFSPNGRTYYVLEHKLSTVSHQAGEKQEIIIDYIELGRDAKCQVRFDEKQSTISRKHAAIIKEDNNWKLRQLSQTNETLLNGRPVKNEWYLQSGDEIQLSVGGPKLGFIVPSNNTVGSIGLSRRMSLFRQQALRPYQKAITTLSIFLFLAIVGGIGAMWHMDDQHAQNILAIEGTIEKQDSTILGQHATIEEQRKSQEQLSESFNRLQDSIPMIENEAKRQAENAARREVERRIAQMPQQVAQGGISSEILEKLKPHIYFVRLTKIVVTINGETQTMTPPEGADRIASGTGFMLANGKFVTARHVVEPWKFINQQDAQSQSPMVFINACAAAGAPVEGYFKAHSSNGTTIDFKTSEFTINPATDQNRSLNTENGPMPLVVAQLNNTDWATLATNSDRGLKHDSQLSIALKTRTQLEVLGFPLGIGYSSPNELEPIYGNCVVARDGLQDGVILVTDRNFEQGNSGGPVFAAKNGEYYVVGLISAGAASSIGLIVPISVIR